MTSLLPSSLCVFLSKLVRSPKIPKMSTTTKSATTPPPTPLATVPFIPPDSMSVVARAYVLAGMGLSRELAGLRSGVDSDDALRGVHQAAGCLSSSAHAITSLAALRKRNSTLDTSSSSPSSSSSAPTRVLRPSQPIDNNNNKNEDAIVKVMHSRVEFDVGAERQQLWLRQLSAMAMVGCTSVATLGLLSGGFVFARALWVFTPITSFMAHRSYLTYESTVEQYTLYALYESDDTAGR